MLKVRGGSDRRRWTLKTRFRVKNLHGQRVSRLSTFLRRTVSIYRTLTGYSVYYRLWTRENGIKMMAFGLKDWTMGVDPFVHATTTRPSSKDRINDPVAVLKGVHSRIISAEKCEKMISYTYVTCLFLSSSPARTSRRPWDGMWNWANGSGLLCIVFAHRFLPILRFFLERERKLECSSLRNRVKISFVNRIEISWSKGKEHLTWKKKK